MATEREAYPYVTKVIDLFGDWLKQRRELNEMTRYAAYPGELGVARELNVTPADLEALVRQGSQGANELSYTLTALGIDETALWRAEHDLVARHGARLFILYAQAPVPPGARGRHCCDELCGILRKLGYDGRDEVQELKITS